MAGASADKALTERVAEKPPSSSLLDQFNGVRVSVSTSLADCEAMWRSAEERCLRFAFQCFEWQAAWQATIGAAEKVVPYIVHCSDPAGRTLLLLPLVAYRYRGLRVLRFLGDVVSDYNAPLVDPGFAAQLDAEQITQLWNTVITLLPEVDLVWLSQMPEVIEGLPNPLINLPGTRHSEDNFAATLPATMAEFRASHAVKWRDTRRRRRRLDETGRVEFDVPKTSGAKFEVLQVLGSLLAGDRFAKPGYFSFYEMLTTTTLPDAEVHVSCLRVDGRIVAAHWGLVFRGCFYNLVRAYDQEWRRYAVGRLLIEHLVEWCIAERRIKVFDLTVAADPSNCGWTDHSLALYELITSYSWRGALYVAALRLRDRLKRHRWLHNLVRYLKERKPI